MYIMKVLILGGGFGKRLEKDVQTGGNDNFKHLIGVPKGLLPIGKHPLMTHWMKILETVEDIDQVYMVTDDVHYKEWAEWAQDWPSVKLFSDGGLSEETKVGAAIGMAMAVEHFNIKDDILVMAADTLFYKDFDMQQIIDQFQAFKLFDEAANMVLYVKCKDEEVHKYGIIEIDKNNKVKLFLDKPNPSHTSSRKASPCFYFVNKTNILLFNLFLRDRKDEPIKRRDSPGNFISYLYEREQPFYAVEISGRFDVGSLHGYIECNKYFAV